MNLSINKWSVSGTVFYLKEMEGEFACSLKISGTAKRPGVYSSSKLEMPCLMLPEAYNQAKRKGLDLSKYQNVSLSGHLESWCNRSSSMPKVYFICDEVIEVGGFEK